MGKQRGPQYYTGTIGPVTYYYLNGGYYLRAKSSLSGNRFWKDKAFAKSREKAKAFGGAAQLAAAIYQQLPKKGRGRGFIGKLTGKVHTALQKGKTATAITHELLLEYGGKIVMIKEDRPLVKQVVQQPSLPGRNRPKVSGWVITPKGALQLWALYTSTSTKHLPQDG